MESPVIQPKSLMIGFLAGAYVSHWFFPDWNFNRKWKLFWSIFTTPYKQTDFESRGFHFFYRVKTALCFVLCFNAIPGRKKRYRFDETTHVVGVLNHHESGGESYGTSWDEVRVGAGIFNNWFWESSHDCSP